MEAKGFHGQVALLQDTVQIWRKGFLAKAKGRDKEIPIRQISSLRFKDADLMSHGYVQFVVRGREAEEDQFRVSGDDEDTVLFHLWERKAFKAIKQAIEQRM